MLKTNSIPNLKPIGSLNEVKVVDNGEKLVPLNGVRPDILVAFSKAFQENTPGSIEKVYVREGVKELLIKAAERLPNGYKLVVWETYTPRALQEHLRGVKLTDISKIMHMTGAGIDVSLADSNGELLDMGSGLNDDEPEKNNTLYFERKEDLTEEEIIARDNRRLLFEIMSSVGFTNNPVDWFHWDYGNLQWAKVKNTTAFYGSIDQ